MLEKFITKIWRFIKKKGFEKFFNRLFIQNKIERVVDLIAEKKKMSFSPNDSWRFKIRFLFRWYEPESVAAAKKFIKPDMNVLDIGAHIGYFSRLFSELVGKRGKVYALEPHQETYNLLVQNISLPKYQNINPVQKALSDKTEKVDFFEVADSGKHSFYNVAYYLSKVDPVGYTFKRKLNVEAITLDEFLGKIGNPEINFIKMDIEGAEPKALRGMEKTVARSKNLAMIVEFNAGTLKAGGVTVPEFLKQLQEMGFKVKDILDAEGKIKSISQLKQSHPNDGYVNLLCLKEN